MSWQVYPGRCFRRRTRPAFPVRPCSDRHRLSHQLRSRHRHRHRAARLRHRCRRRRCRHPIMERPTARPMALLFMAVVTPARISSPPFRMAALDSGRRQGPVSWLACLGRWFPDFLLLRVCGAESHSSSVMTSAWRPRRLASARSCIGRWSRDSPAVSLGTSARLERVVPHPTYNSREYTMTCAVWSDTF